MLRGLSKRYRMPPKQPDSPQRSVCDIDLYTVLPKARSEPVYVKSDWERELEGALRRVLINREPNADLDVPPNVRYWG